LEQQTATSEVLRSQQNPTRNDDALGRLALALCEALLHVLVEQRIITTAHALEAIDTVIEREREVAANGKRVRRRRGGAPEAVAIMETMAMSFTARSWRAASATAASRAGQPSRP
jgi:hypothetical protein